MKRKGEMLKTLGLRDLKRTDLELPLCRYLKKPFKTVSKGDIKKTNKKKKNQNIAKWIVSDF